MPETAYTTPIEQRVDDTAPSILHEEPGRVGQIAQEYGRRAAAVVLVGGATLGLVACEPGDQTIEIGRAVPEKVLSKSGASITTGLCVERTQTIYVGKDKKEQKSHNCSPQDDQLREQTVAQVRAASGDNTHFFKGVDTSKDCKNPSVAFINSLRVGDVIAKQKENYRKFDEKGRVIADEEYCVWEKR